MTDIYSTTQRCSVPLKITYPPLSNSNCSKNTPFVSLWQNSLYRIVSSKMSVSFISLCSSHFHPLSFRFRSLMGFLFFSSFLFKLHCVVTCSCSAPTMMEQELRFLIFFFFFCVEWEIQNCDGAISWLILFIIWYDVVVYINAYLVEPIKYCFWNFLLMSFWI